ncbi:MAG: hypothetical protein COB53_05885 [Elusimicrobia bacterium]|nr:MAG: hypothetical protein COB53_05885 [Elusimicrobiota bacterium]
MFRLHLSDKDKETFTKARTRLCQEYHVTDLEQREVTSYIDEISKFSILGQGEETIFCDGFRLTYEGRSAFMLAVCNRYEQVSTGAEGQVHRNSIDNTFAVVIFDLFIDLGHVLIRPESLGDKISEFFSPTEVDFPEHPEFCSRNYVLSKDHALLKSSATNAFLELLGGFADLHLEILDKKALSYRPKNINIADISDLAKLSLVLPGTL